MQFPSRLFRATIWLASTSLSLASVAPTAWAQPASSDGGDPPALAGRISALSGTVSTHAAGETDWAAAALNSPVTTGDSFWTQPQSSATLEIGADHFVLNEATELDIAGLDQSQFTGTQPQGEIFLNLPELPPGQAFTLNTPRGAVQISAQGQYDIIAGDTASPTIVTVLSGAATVVGSGVNISIGPNQQASITGTDQLAGNVGLAQPDDFARAQIAAATPAPPCTCPPVVGRMTGGSDLARYGTWQASPQYGQVWYPNNVGADWAPYRDGRWSYVAPWGWTWVDSAPWGFAPFHYGRWVSYGGRWGWVAAAPDAPVEAYPVYAPALVAFVGLGGAALAGISLGFGGGGFREGGGIGWVPLGFREPYRPWYHASDHYFQSVNRVSVVNVTNYHINNFREVNHYENARAATVIPAGAMTRGVPIGGIARPLPEAALARAQPVSGRLPVRPTAQTPGLTRAEARRYNVALPARPVGRVAPGPAFHPGGPVAHPALRPAGSPNHPGEQFPGGLAAPRASLPPLRPASELRTRPAPAPNLANPARPSPGTTPTLGDRRGPQSAPRPSNLGVPPHPADHAPPTRPDLRSPPSQPALRSAPPHAAEHAVPHAPARPPISMRPSAAPGPEITRHTKPPRPAEARVIRPSVSPQNRPPFHPAERSVAPRPVPAPRPEFHPAPRPAPPAPRPEPKHPK